MPDHATIARFICRHEQALADLFGEVLKLCDRAGLVKPGVVSIDGTRIAGNASPEVNHTFDQIAREVLAEVPPSHLVGLIRPAEMAASVGGEGERNEGGVPTT